MPLTDSVSLSRELTDSSKESQEPLKQDQKYLR